MTGPVLVGAKLAASTPHLVQHAVELADGGAVSVVHVRENPTAWAWPDPTFGAVLRIWQMECEAEVRTAAIVALESCMAPWRIEVIEGNPAKALAARATADGASTIVIGKQKPARRRLRPRRPVLDRLRTLAPCPVIEIETETADLTAVRARVGAMA